MLKRVTERCSACLLLLLLASCATLGGRNVPIVQESLQLFDGVRLVTTSVVDNLASVMKDGKVFRPNRSDSLILEVHVSVINDTSDDLDYSLLRDLEVLVIDGADSSKFLSSTTPFDASSYDQFNSILGGKKRVISAHSKADETLYFVRSWTASPAALVFSRGGAVWFVGPESATFAQAGAFLKKQATIKTLFQMARSAPYSEVKAFMKAEGLPLNTVDRSGINLLVAGIISGNDSVVDGSLEDGCDSRLVLSYNLDAVLPIHLAILYHNEHALQALVKAGSDVRYHDEKIEEPASLAIKSKDIVAVKMLKDHGVDLKSVRIRAGWNTLPAAEYAKRWKLPEILELIESNESR